MKFHSCYGLVLLLAALYCPPVYADTLHLTDGRILTGNILHVCDDEVVFSVQVGTAEIRQRYPRSLVKEIEKQSREGASYVVISMSGSIGFFPDEDKFVTAEGIRRSIVQAKKENPDVIILEIDSHGGSIEEMKLIIEQLESLKDVRVVAWVKEALSAAAVIAMTIPEIVIHPSGTIGAAVPYKVGPSGTPEAVEEKFQSAIRAEFRKAAISGGHSELLILGMMDQTIELSLLETDVDSRVVLSHQAPHASRIKSAGQILTLTAAEACRYGLAVGKAESADALQRALGIEQWYEIPSTARHIAANYARAEQRRFHRETRIAAMEQFRMQEWSRYAPELDEIHRSMRMLDQELAATERSIQALFRQRSRAIDAIDRQYNANVESAYSTNNPRYWVSEARAIYNSELSKIIQSFDPKIAALELELNRAQGVRNELVRRSNTIQRYLKDL